MSDQKRRAAYADVTRVVGTLTHYDFSPFKKNWMNVRYVTCVCHHCRAEDWNCCVNKAYVGEWDTQEMKTENKKEQRADDGIRADMSNLIADAMCNAPEMPAAVALFTKHGSWNQIMWLMQPVERPWVVPVNSPDITCPRSKEKFSAGMRVFKGYYYDRVTRGDELLYEYMPDLGLFILPVSMLRAGGTADPVILVEDLLQRRTSRHQGSSDSRKYFRLELQCKQAIEYLIHHVYQDKDV